MDNITNMGMLPYYYKKLFMLCMLVCFTFLFVLFILGLCMHYSFVFYFEQKKCLKRKFCGEANEQLQRVLLTDLRLITNIFNNLVHSNQNAIKSLGLNDTFTSPYVHPFNVCIIFNHVQEKKSRDVNLLQYYMFDSSLIIPIYTTHLPPNLQSFIMTSSFFLRLHLP
jgi:hypothetical protein